MIHWLVNLLTDYDRIVSALDERSLMLVQKEQRLRSREWELGLHHKVERSAVLTEALRNNQKLESELALKTKQCEHLHREYTRVVEVAEKHGMVIVEVPCRL